MRLRVAPAHGSQAGAQAGRHTERGEAMNDSNGRKGYEAENGSGWQLLAVFRQTVTTRRARNPAAGLRSSRSSKHRIS
jgi:hypothetical protein